MLASSFHHLTSGTSSSPHNRIVLLFDLDCFYAQCERVRLGLPEDVSLALLQWNSVLAVTYPARKFGIKRGDSWDEVAEKSQNTCWAIHLPVLEVVETTTSNKTTTTKPKPIQNPYAKPLKSTITENNDASEESASTTTNHQHEDVASSEPQESSSSSSGVTNVEDAYNEIYKLSREEQLECQKRERGVRRLHNEGKACLERYRLASMRIFSVVLESLMKHLGDKEKFILERASIDEFYLDITTYCYEFCTLTAQEMTHKTVAVGEGSIDNLSLVNTAAHTASDLQSLALQRACQVSHCIRQDVFETLGFTMSAGICTNKMMAKLAATYGKPKGQAVLHPRNFQPLLETTKVRKVRHFGGKLGKQVLKVLQEQSINPASFDGDSATMTDLQQIPLPMLQQHFSEETANFVFEACRGVDGEAVKETTGALIKSITAFKSFPATSLLRDIQNWVTLMANEIVTRVSKDSVRNHRYPKTCTLNYTYYATDSGKRPTGVTSTRSFRNSKSIRLNFPHEKNSQKVQHLVQQSLQKLCPILKQHALRGVGLSASNFEIRGCPPEGVKGITTFFAKKEEEDILNGSSTTNGQVEPTTSNTSKNFTNRKRKQDIEQFFCSQSQNDLVRDGVTIDDKSVPGPSQEQFPTTQTNQITSSHCNDRIPSKSGFQRSYPTLATPPASPYNTSSQQNQTDEDQELAKRLQASFDRENYVLSAANRFRPGSGASSNICSKIQKPVNKKVRRIDTFFGKK